MNTDKQTTASAILNGDTFTDDMGSTFVAETVTLGRGIVRVKTRSGVMATYSRNTIVTIHLPF